MVLSKPQRPKARLTTLEKQHRRTKWLALAHDVKAAQDEYADTAKKIAKGHQR
jgi:hypothetical protein